MPATFRNITPRVVAELARGNVSAPANTFVRDTALPGFAIRVGRTKSSFVVEGRTGRSGRVVRYTLGTVGRLALDEARTQAKEKIGELARGADPVEALRRKRGATITLRQALALLAAGRDVKPSTVADYERSLVALGWMDRRLAGIKEPDVLAAYDARREHQTSAARIFRSFRTCWNAAKAKHPTLPACPTAALRNARRSWATAPRKRRVIADADLPAWRRQVDALKHEGVRDLILFLHFSGARVSEARALTAADVNLRAGWFRLAEPKNGRPVELPITRQLHTILSRRLAAVPDGALFPQYDVRKLHATVDVAPWSYHDLRRGYITAAHRVGIDNEHARRLTNHATPAAEAHAGYIITDPDTLRPSAQRIADHFDGLARRRRARASTQ